MVADRLFGLIVAVHQVELNLRLPVVGAMSLVGLGGRGLELLTDV